jgi:hypothetical protein
MQDKLVKPLSAEYIFNGCMDERRKLIFGGKRRSPSIIMGELFVENVCSAQNPRLSRVAVA